MNSAPACLSANIVLDIEEVFHLALAAIGEQAHDRAIDILKKGVASFPGDGRLLYLLGAEHAQIGLYDRATLEIAGSIALDDSVPMAHLQLGLVHLIRGDVVAARLAWGALTRLGTNDPVRAFADGLTSLTRDDAAGAMAHLERAAALCADNPALLAQIQRFLNATQSASGAADHAQTGTVTAPAGGHVLLSAYAR